MYVPEDGGSLLHGRRDAAEHVDLGAQVDDVVHGLAEQRGLVPGGVPSGNHLPERHGPPPHQPPRDVAARRRRRILRGSGVASSSHRRTS